ncbi:putative uncharacterized protein DDB_G0289263 isoform X1 [Bombus vosnesenskii]|uniref:Uncharacterized protein n=1 Tax=Bombus vosnesenskii TaxID=207650 RepID=A0A6J3LE94_9HYME|nr:putative uncharacterized protein DDB_G0289263 isoform X1 [Bombus vosnesenskii]
MIKRRKASKLPVQINEDGDTNNISKDNILNVKEKTEYDLSQKMNMKQKVKQKGTKKCQKVSKQINVSNMILKYNAKAYKYQIQQLNLLFKKSLKYSMLTQDELYMLFAKYKSDGHYKINKNLPPFTSLLVNTHDMLKENHCYDQFSDIQKAKPENSGETIANSYSNTVDKNQHAEENPKVYEILQSNVKQDALKCTETPQVNNIDSRIQNKHLYNDQNFLHSSNYNHLYMNYNMQSHNNLDILNDIQYCAQSKVDAKKVSDAEKKQFSCNLIKSQDITSEQHQNCRYMNKNLLCNIPDTQYENLTNSEIPQQNDIHYSLQYNNFSLNPNFYNDCYLNKCNNVVPINNNNNYQSKNVQSICIPHINNLESCLDMKNLVAPHQLTRNHLEEQGNLNLPIRTETYSVLSNKNLPYVSNEDVSNIQGDFNVNDTNSTVISDDILSQTNAFIPLHANMANQYN